MVGRGRAGVGASLWGNGAMMEVRKIWRVGNSNVVSLPRKFVRAGYDAGRPVVIEQLETGELLLRPVEDLRPHVRDAARRAAEKHRAALDILAAHDSGEG
jgi:hypothetical protein